MAALVEEVRHYGAVLLTFCSIYLKEGDLPTSLTAVVGIEYK